MSTTLGTDVYSLDDLDETRVASGVALVAQDAVWRLQTPRGMGILAEDAPDFGMDLLGAIGSVQSAADAASLPGQIRAELTKDDRILSVDATVTRTTDGPAAAYDIHIQCETAEGPFALVGNVTDDADALNLGVDLLKGAA